MAFWLIYLALGAVAGILAGLLGVGGGLVLVAALAWLLPYQGFAADAVMHVALATSLASIILTGLASARAHHRRGSVGWGMVAWLLPGLLLGAWGGVYLAVALAGDTLRWLVASYCYLAAAQLAFARAQPLRTHDDDPHDAGLALAGLGIGALSAVVGIGGGSMTVPLLIWRGVAAVRAVGTSSACGVAIAVASAAGYALHTPQAALPAGSVGFVFVPAALAIALASVSVAPLGVRLAHWLSGHALKRVFAVFLLLVGSSLWLR